MLPAVALKWLLKVKHYKGYRWRYVGLVLRALRDGLLSRKKVDHNVVLDWAEETPRA